MPNTSKNIDGIVRKMERSRVIEPALGSIPAESKLFVALKKFNRSLRLFIKLRKKTLLVIVSLGGLIIIFAVVGHVNHNPFPATVRGSVDFPLYYPSYLPKNYAVDQGSMNVASDVVMYAAKNNDGQKIFFTVQPKPPSTDLLYQRILQNIKEVSSDEGKGVVGEYGNQTAGSLLTDRVLVLIIAPQTVSKDTMKSIVTGLKKF